MPGCALLILIALALLLSGQASNVDGLPLGFLVGLVAGFVLSLLGTYNAGWNAHVDHVETRDHIKAAENAQRDRK
jgi:4-hydroxybenzoate polyprenyltransferase